MSRLAPLDLESWTTWLEEIGCHGPEAAAKNIQSIQQSGITDDLWEVLQAQLRDAVQLIGDASRAINNLERFFSATRSPLSLAALMERDPNALSILVQLFSASQHCSDLLVRQPEYFDHIRLTAGQPVSREDLIDDLTSEIENVSDRNLASKILRRFKHRETLRIAYGDIILGLPVETTTAQISHLADSVCHAAYLFERSQLEEKFGVPRDAQGKAVPLVIMALGKLGGVELNYSSDIDLILCYENEGETDGRRSRSCQEFFDTLTQNFRKLLDENTELGIAYRVDFRLRPDGSTGRLTRSLDRMLDYYELKGRTWERQAWLKARPAAGDLSLGGRLLKSLSSWARPTFLNQFQIEGTKALKRQIERRALKEGQDDHDVKTGRGGIRDVEFVIQFMQLLNAADSRAFQVGNTLSALGDLQRIGCLNTLEEHLLRKNYCFLRQVEHRLQLMFDLQTHQLPDSQLELLRLARRCGFTTMDDTKDLENFHSELEEARSTNRQILDHILHNAFGPQLAEAGSDQTLDLDENSQHPANVDFSEVDLVLDPDPDEETIDQTLQTYGFSDTKHAYHHLMELSRESNRFLSDYRARHFLASIAGKLLQAISKTPDPDFTLRELSQVANSLGGKAVLWELFSFSQPSLDLCVRLSAVAPYLTGILTGNPGMLDELMDSLLLGKLPDYQTLQEKLNDLLMGAEDPEPILQSFKDAQHLLVGTRDILAKEKLPETLKCLSDIAEVCTLRVIDQNYDRLCEELGTPFFDGEEPKKKMPLVVMAMGKLGGREPNYHSDLDLIFIYQQDGQTVHQDPSKQTSHQHFFSQLATRVTRSISQVGPFGRLYDVDCRLRPSGRGGSLAVSLSAFRQYFESGQGQLWEQQSLCKARALGPENSSTESVRETIKEILSQTPSADQIANAVYKMRLRMEEGATAGNIKRGFGGTVDIEFIVQMLLLIHLKDHPDLLDQNCVGATGRLEELGLLTTQDANFMVQSYEFLRGIESRIRLMNSTGRHEFPSDPVALRKLAYLLRIENPEFLVETLAHYRQANRRLFKKLVGQWTTIEG